MTPKQLEAIKRHGERLLAIFPNATERDPVKLCKRMRRIETAAHRHFEAMCSEADYYNLHSNPDGGEDLKAERFAEQARKLLGSERPWVNHDPRGYALKVNLMCPQCGSREHWSKQCDGHAIERLHTDWGGYGILAPEIGPEGE